MALTLEQSLEQSLAAGKTDNDFSVQQLRRQINAKKNGKTFQDLYVTGSVKKQTN